MDLFVVPTIGFNLLYAFVIVRLGRRELVWINVTANPTAEWIARQIAEAFPWDVVPQHLICDRDRIYGTIVTRRLAWQMPAARHGLGKSEPEGARIPAPRIHQANVEKAMQSRMMFSDRLLDDLRIP